MTSANECSGVPIGECSLRRRRQGINNNIYIQAKLFISLPVHNHSLNPFSFFQGDRTTRKPRSGPLFFFFWLPPPSTCLFASVLLSRPLSSSLASPRGGALSRSHSPVLPVSKGTFFCCRILAFGARAKKLEDGGWRMESVRQRGDFD